MIETALRAGLPYVDVAAEIEANLDTSTHFAVRARATGAVVVPAMAFFGGLGDLLVTAAMGDWTSADEAHVAYGLSGWHPTAGTRVAVAVSGNAGTAGASATATTSSPSRPPGHPEVCTYMTVEAAGELSAAERRAVASGQDIYAVSAPLAVEAVHRVLTGRTRTAGVASAGAIFDPVDSLRALSAHISLDLPK
ncbi:hypothetical protein [Micromonospora sp. CPCC 205561]|uniref:hypothetical protein n=1 Tax=Micromonospora sp. CPCC 205561 TaxID=3122407 RepID=UPI002FF3288C